GGRSSPVPAKGRLRRVHGPDAGAVRIWSTNMGWSLGSTGQESAQERAASRARWPRARQVGSCGRIPSRVRPPSCIVLVWQANTVVRGIAAARLVHLHAATRVATVQPSNIAQSRNDCQLSHNTRV